MLMLAYNPDFPQLAKSCRQTSNSPPANPQPLESQANLDSRQAKVSVGRNVSNLSDNLAFPLFHSEAWIYLDGSFVLVTNSE
jgi:hypothetical protein